MDILFLVAGSFDLDHENTLDVLEQRPHRAAQNWQDWSGRSSGISAARVFQLALLVSHNQQQFLRALHFVLECALQFCNPIVSLLTLHDKIGCHGCSFEFLPG
jgi:hypothetical protein